MFTNETNKNDKPAEDLLQECGRINNGKFTFKMVVDDGQIHDLLIERDLINYDFETTR